jgi:hypothetical protein
MRIRRGTIATALVVTTFLAAPAHSVPVVFGTSWDGPSYNLQNMLDAIYGSGRIHVATGYVGAQPGDLDPWFWVDNQASALLVREIAGNRNRNLLGWYEETYSMPVIDGVGDGVVFDGPASRGDETLVVFDRPMTRFGFYLDPNGPLDAPNAPQPERFFTNRAYNDRGPNGAGAIHAPWDGDVQVLVFDISEIRGVPNTWLVCFEDLDTGPMPSPCCSGADNDFNDLIFEVHAFGATPTRPMSFADLKQLYR